MIYFQKIWKTNYQTICPKFEKGGFDSKECDLAAKLAYFGLLAIKYPFNSGRGYSRNLVLDARPLWI